MASGDDLFSQAAEQRVAAAAPLASRMRPRSLDEIVGQQHLLGPGKPLRALIEADRLSSCILWGPAGTGKTTIARLVARATAKAFEPMSAVTAGVKEVREVVERARTRLGERGQGTIMFLDEIHRFNRTQQDALLPHVEEGLLTLIGATTENPFFEVNGPLRSRSTLFRLEALSTDDLRALIDRALTDPARGLAARRRDIAIDEEAAAHLAARSDGDARAALNGLEVAAALAAEAGRTTITLDDAETAINLRAVRYGRDEHYDVISAFIKSIRGSDPDAGVYWLARMLEAGEDARFIARRLVILASEDIGLADPMALVVATAAAHAVEYVGLPEAQLNLAEAVIYLATAPKSNRAALAIWRAREDVRTGPVGRGARPPARRPLPGGEEPRPRQGLRLPPRRPDRLGRPAVQALRARRPPLLRAQPPRRRSSPPARRHRGLSEDYRRSMRARLGLLITVFGPGLTACGGSDRRPAPGNNGAKQVTSRRRSRSGALVPLSGDNALFGEEMLNAAQPCRRRSQRLGRCAGPPHRDRLRDDGCDPNAAPPRRRSCAPAASSASPAASARERRPRSAALDAKGIPYVSAFCHESRTYRSRAADRVPNSGRDDQPGRAFAARSWPVQASAEACHRPRQLRSTPEASPS